MRPNSDGLQPKGNGRVLGRARLVQDTMTRSGRSGRSGRSDRSGMSGMSGMSDTNDMNDMNDQSAVAAQQKAALT